MRDAKRQAHFLEEALEARRVAFDVAREELQRDALAQLQIVGAVDLAHTATAEQADDAVALGEDVARDEAGAFGVAAARYRRPGR
ncbi:MAG: hypothetical protein ACYTGG_10110 [Planctomycetota bacterium]